MLSRDQFLASVIVAADGHRYSVRDVIAFEANIMGAIHAGSADTEKEKVLRRTEEIFRVGGYPSSLGQLKAIGRVVSRALKPLRNAVESS